MASFHPLKKPTVLIAEDQSLIRMCTAVFLEDDGYRVLEAANGQEALAVLRHDPEVALLLTDLSMPGDLDGLALVESTVRDYPHIKSVIVSGSSTLHDICIPGAGRFVPKPYTPRQISETVRQLLS